MIRHYLPSIAATIALLLAIVFVPVGEKLTNKENLSSNYLKAQTVSAANKCSDSTVGVSLLITIESKNTNRSNNAIDGSGCGQSRTNMYDPPILLERVQEGCCFGLFNYWLDGSVAYSESWNSGAGLDVSYTSQPGGGILMDSYENCTSNGVFMTLSNPTYIEYNTTNDTAQASADVNDMSNVDLGSIKDLMGGKFIDNSNKDANLKVRQIIKISPSGSGKIGLGDPNSTSKKDQTDGSINLNSLEDDLNQHVFVCKDSEGNGKCDSEECDATIDPICSDGLDNDGDGLTDFPSDKGCTSATDGDETNPVCNDGIDNDSDGRTDYPEDPGCDSAADTDETSPQCADGIDNDSDGVIDFENGDLGCDSIKDNDETNPPIDRNITITKGLRPQLIIQPKLDRDEIIILPAACSTCTVTASPDPANITWESPINDEGFVMIITNHDSSDDSYGYTILAVGDYSEHSKLFTGEGKEYYSAVE